MKITRAQFDKIIENDWAWHFGTKDGKITSAQITFEVDE